MNILVVEDDSVAIEILMSYLREFKIDKAVDIARSFKSAKSKLNKETYDLLFLDMHLGDGKGLDLINDTTTNSGIIFITSDPDYAVNAFEINALDYLLKPFTKERFERTIKRVNEKRNTPKDSIVIRVDYSFQRVSFSDIFYIKSNADYLTMVTKNGDYTFYGRLKNIIQQLPENTFKKCHRSFIVNLKEGEKIRNNSITINGIDIPISAKYKGEIALAFR